ncbi:uncharacterized protein RHO17_023194 isoform 1-T1 [Thomomys bottae]
MELRSSLLGPTDARLAPLCRRSLQIVPWIGSEVTRVGETNKQVNPSGNSGSGESQPRGTSSDLHDSATPSTPHPPPLLFPPPPPRSVSYHRQVCTIWRKLHLANRCGRWFDVRGPQSSLASWHRIVWRSPSLQITLQDRSWGLSSEPGHCV